MPFIKGVLKSTIVSAYVTGVLVKANSQAGQPRIESSSS